MRRTYDLAALLRRKMTDYGYSTINELADALGTSDSHLYSAMIGAHGVGIELRRSICLELDIHPDVLKQALDKGWTPERNFRDGESNPT